MGIWNKTKKYNNKLNLMKNRIKEKIIIELCWKKLKVKNE
jgi:hypothetical protein